MRLAERFREDRPGFLSFVLSIRSLLRRRAGSITSDIMSWSARADRALNPARGRGFCLRADWMELISSVADATYFTVLRITSTAR